jgi:hypothetical protein
MQASGHGPDDADRSAVGAHRAQQLHEAMLDHAIWQRLLRQTGPQSAHDVVWLDERWQPPGVRPLDDAFLVAHQRLLRALHNELIAVGGSPPAPLGGIVAYWETGLPDDRLETDEGARTVDTVDWAALLARSLALQSQAQHLLRRSAQTVQDARQAWTQVRSLV